MRSYPPQYPHSSDPPKPIHLPLSFFSPHTPPLSLLFLFFSPPFFSFLSFFLVREEFLLKTDSGYPRDTRVTLFNLATHGNSLRHNTPRSALPVAALAHSRGRGPSHQSHVLGHRDTCGQAQVCSKGHEGSSVDRPCQLSFWWIELWYAQN